MRTSEFNLKQSNIQSFAYDWLVISLFIDGAGDTGLGVRMKLVLGMFVGTTLAALAESLALSAKLGLNLTHVLDVLRHSSANSQFVQQKGAGMS